MVSFVTLQRTDDRDIIVDCLSGQQGLSALFETLVERHADVTATDSDSDDNIGETERRRVNVLGTVVTFKDGQTTRFVGLAWLSLNLEVDISIQLKLLSSPS